MSKKTKKMLSWRVHTRGLLEEIQSNFQSPMVLAPIKILDSLLRQVAKRAIELDDKKLNALMIRLTLYSIADPNSPDYRPKIVLKILEEDERTITATTLISNKQHILRHR